MYDKELKQIKKKYKAPEYRPSTKIKNSYTKISIGIIILAILALATVYFFGIWGNRAGTDDFVFPCCSTFILFLILLSYVRGEVKKSDIVASEESWGAVQHAAPAQFRLLISLGLDAGSTDCTYGWA